MSRRRSVPAVQQFHQTPGDAAADPALRAQVAARMLAQRTVLVSRIRRQLYQRGLAPQLADDIFSTTVRRTDALLAAGRLIGEIPDTRLIGLATAIARNAVRESSRAARRDQLKLDASSEQARSGDPAPAVPDGDRDIERLLARIDARALALLGLRLRGAGWPTIASELDMSIVAAQRLYYRALKRLAASPE